MTDSILIVVRFSIVQDSRILYVFLYLNMRFIFVRNYVKFYSHIFEVTTQAYSFVTNWA